VVLSVLELFELTENVFLINLCFLFWEQGVGGSNPIVPTRKDEEKEHARIGLIRYSFDFVGTLGFCTK